MEATVASRRAVRLGVGAGLVAPPLLVTVFVGLTIGQLAFLRSIGWSALRRTPVGWPSVLALGLHGWVEQVAFVVAGDRPAATRNSHDRTEGRADRRANRRAGRSLATFSLHRRDYAGGLQETG